MDSGQLRQCKHDWGDAAAAASEAFGDIRAPESIDELGFTPQPMVAWYSPKELVITGFRAAVSAIFGAYADKREIEAALWQGEWQDYSDYLQREGEIWIDYVADLGDGFSPTYTVARLIAAPELELAHGDTSCRTRRGNILLMGGDQVYPTATLEEYRDRLAGPYRCALPAVPNDDQAPHLYAVPGNHDWYDGLNSFVKLFCQQRWIGAWKTRQKRSYFAIKLADDLWIWGIDIQLNSDIDKPQLDYFERVATTMQAGSSVLLCTAEPSWAYVETKTRQLADRPAEQEAEKQNIYRNFGYLQDKVVRKFGHEVLIGLAGDAHEYARYEADDGSGRQRFVAGGGGAYLYPTHHMPDTLTMPRQYGGESYRLNEKVFPDRDTSRKLARRSLLFPFFRVNLGFVAFLGSFNLLLAWIMQSVSRNATAPGASLLESLAADFDYRPILEVLRHSPASVSFLLLLVFGLVAFSPCLGWPRKILHGGLHALAQIALFFTLMAGFGRLNLGVLGLELDEFRQVALFAAEMVVVGGVAGACLFGLYLWLSNRLLGLHDNEALLCQSSPDYKHFLRCRIGRDGSIDIYPIGVPTVIGQGWSLSRRKNALRGWALNSSATGSEAWFEPEHGSVVDSAVLIEAPVRLTWRRPAG